MFLPTDRTFEPKMQIMRIYFNTALYDEIVRDKDGKMPIHQVRMNIGHITMNE